MWQKIAESWTRHKEYYKYDQTGFHLCQIYYKLLILFKTLTRKANQNIIICKLISNPIQTNSVMQEPQEFYSLTTATNWEVAQRHAQAAKVGKQLKNNDFFQDYCQCCHSPVQKQPFKLCENIKQLHYLGFGVPLFYLFLQCCIILNLLLIVTDSIYILSKSAINSASKCKNYDQNNSTGPTHHSFSSSHAILSGLMRKRAHNVTYDEVDQSLRLQCTNFFVYYAQIDKNFSTYEEVTRICSIVIHFCCLLFIKSKIIKRNHYYDEVYYHQADYSVIFKQLQPEITKKKWKIRQLLVELERQIHHHFQTAEIMVVPENQFLEKKIIKKQQLLQTYLQNKQTDGELTQQTRRQLLEVQKDLFFISSKCKDMIQQDQIDSKNVIVVFEKEEDKIKFLSEENRIRELPSFRKLGGTSITRIQMCPDPKEIIWNNLKYTSVRRGKVVFVWFLSLCFLVVTYLLFYQLQSYKNQTIRHAFLLHYQNKPGADEQRQKARIIGWATWIGIIFYNKLIMSKVLQYLTKFQKHDNVANQDFSFAFKYSIGMFFTSSIMKIMVQAVQNHNYYKHDFGIIEQESMMFVFSAVFLPLIWVIHPLRLLHLFKRFWYKDKLNITQAYANYLAAQYPYRIGKRYAQIIQMMWFCFLYVDLIPLGSCFIFVGQYFYYWIDKYNLLRRSSFNYKLSGSLSKKMLPLLDLTLVWRFLGAFIFDIQLREYINPVTIVMLFVSICFLLMPWERILQYFDHEQYLLNNEKYSEAKKRIFKNTSYATENPIQNFVYLNLVLQRRTHILGS